MAARPENDKPGQRERKAGGNNRGIGSLSKIKIGKSVIEMQCTRGAKGCHGGFQGSNSEETFFNATIRFPAIKAAG